MKVSVSLGFLGGQGQFVWENTYVLTLASLEGEKGRFGRVFGGSRSVFEEDKCEEDVTKLC